MYLLQMFSYDHTNNPATNGPAIGTNITTIAPNTAHETTGTTGTVTWTAGVTPTFNDQYSTTLLLTSNALGELSVLASAVRVPMPGDTTIDNVLRINGFILSVPEPASMAVLGLGGVALLARRTARPVRH